MREEGRRGFGAILKGCWVAGVCGGSMSYWDGWIQDTISHLQLLHAGFLIFCGCFFCNCFWGFCWCIDLMMIPFSGGGSPAMTKKHGYR